MSDELQIAKLSIAGFMRSNPNKWIQYSSDLGGGLISLTGLKPFH